MDLIRKFTPPPPMHALLPRLGGMLTPVPHSKSILGYGK